MSKQQTAHAEIAKHTPGPWEAAEHGDYGDYDGQCIVVLGDDLRIAVVLGEGTPETRANARLMAAAPELLEALQYMTALALGPAGGVSQQQKSDVLTKARAAIAKATGGEA